MLSADESAWVERFVSAGGSYEHGAQIVRRMNLPGTHSPGALMLSTSQQAPLQKTLVETESFETHTVSAKTASELALPQVPKKRGRPPVNWKDRPKSQQELDLFDLSLEIEEKNAAQHGQLGFIATAMIYASLPHSQIDSAVFKRKSGNISLTILNDPDIGLPFGKIPRIITAFLCTEAKRTQSPEIELGRSQAEFAKKLGLNSGGGKRGDLTRLKDQAVRLFTSHITLTGTPDAQFHWRNVNLTDNGMLLWSPHDAHAQKTWESRLTLSQVFFAECIDHSVPIDLRVIHKLASPLAIDIYVWLTYRLNSISYPTPISWQQLKWQFGSNYADDPQGLRNFASAFKTQLRRVITAYPSAKISTDAKKLTLFPSSSHISSVK